MLAETKAELGKRVYRARVPSGSSQEDEKPTFVFSFPISCCSTTCTKPCSICRRCAGERGKHTAFLPPNIISQRLPTQCLLLRVVRVSRGPYAAAEHGGWWTSPCQNVRTSAVTVCSRMECSTGLSWCVKRRLTQATALTGGPYTRGRRGEDSHGHGDMDHLSGQEN